MLPVFSSMLSKKLVALVEHPCFASLSSMAILYTSIAVLLHASMTGIEDNSIWHPDNWAIMLAQLLLVVESALRLIARVDALNSW